MNNQNGLIRKISFKYELLDYENKHKKWLYNIMSSSISYKWLSQLKSSATIIMTDDETIDYVSDRIKIYMTLDGKTSSLGVFLMSTPLIKTQATGLRIREIACYSLLQVLLDDKITVRLQLPVGTNVINEVIRQIGSNPYSISEANHTLSNVKEYEIGTSRIEIINDLLNVINYDSLNVDVNGYFTTKPYVLPTDKIYELTLDEGTNVIQRETTNELDLFDVPNVFVRYSNSLEMNPPLSYTYINDNVSSITSTTNRGRRIVSCASVEATDIQTLVSITKKDAYEASSIYGHITFNTAPNIKLLGNYMPCVWVKVNDINDKYLITSIDFSCKTGEQLKVQARKVVQI